VAGRSSRVLRWNKGAAYSFSSHFFSSKRILPLASLSARARLARNGFFTNVALFDYSLNHSRMAWLIAIKKNLNQTAFFAAEAIPDSG
jgi:hypothetical protein